MESLKEIVESVVNFAVDHNQWRKVIAYLQERTTILKNAMEQGSARSIPGSSALLDEVQTLLDRGAYFVAVQILLLHFDLHLPNTMSSVFIDKVGKCFRGIPKQHIEYNMNDALRLCRVSTALACSEGVRCARRLVRPLMCLIEELQTMHGHTAGSSTCISSNSNCLVLTAAHSALYQACITGQVSHIAAEFITAQHCQGGVANIVDLAVHPLTSSEYLGVWYYAGSVMCSMGRYEQALEFFTEVLRTPSQPGCTALLVVEAFKKCKILSLLQNNVDFHIPAHAPAFLKRVSEIYERDMPKPLPQPPTAAEADAAAAAGSSELSTSSASAADTKKDSSETAASMHGEQSLAVTLYPYFRIGDAFTKVPSPLTTGAGGDTHVALLVTALEQDKWCLERDGNYFLAKQLPTTLVRWKIRNLLNTYVTLSLADVGRLSELSSVPESYSKHNAHFTVESEIMGLVREGVIEFASIDGTTGLVVFDEKCLKDSSAAASQSGDGAPMETGTSASGGAPSSAPSSSCAYSVADFDSLRASIRDTIALSSVVDTMQKRVVTSERYILRVNTKQHAGRKGAAAGRFGPGPGGGGGGGEGTSVMMQDDEEYYEEADVY